MNNHMIQGHVVRGKEIFVGLEDSKRTWKITVRCDRMVVRQASMEARYPVLLSYLRNNFPECTINLIYEAGFKGFTLHDRLTEDGITCVVIPPHLVTEPKVNRVKTDRRDAGRLALILENGDMPSLCCVPDRERREDRQISRTLIAVGKDIIRTRNRVHKLLDFHGIGVPFETKAKWGEKEFGILRELPVSAPLRASLDVLLDLLEHLWRHRETLTAYLKGLCDKERYRKAFAIAESLPGIGWKTAIRFVLEFGEDFSRFTSGKKIAAFAGLTSREHSTGETERRGKITGLGQGFIRSTLIENSWAAIRKDQALLAKFTRVWRNSGSKKKAIVAVARTLVIRLRACMVSGTPYATGIVR
jgi:transposase